MDNGVRAPEERDHHPVRKDGPSVLLLSINPDLQGDFGHFLNYEKRIGQVCRSIGVAHHCLCNVAFETSLPHFSPVFERNSAYYSVSVPVGKAKKLAVCRELHELITNWFETEKPFDRFDVVIAFIYQSSSITAGYLADMEWPDNFHIICNAFWDFRIDLTSSEGTDFARLKHSGSVSLTAMSVPHGEQIYNATGCCFAAIPHPPPLVSDARFFELLRASAVEKADRYRHLPPTVLLPGLLSIGKGKEITEEFVASAARENLPAQVMVRDRNRLLSQEVPETELGNLRYMLDDFSDSEIINFYRQADVAALPYTSDVFGVRTSGALVDCIMAGVVPVVFPDTWLSHICEKFGFGIVCSASTAAAMSDGISEALADLPAQRQRMFIAAIRYMSDNSWGQFLAVLLEQGGQGAALETVRESSWSFLQAARKAMIVLLEGQTDLRTLSADTERWRLVRELFDEQPDNMMEERA